MLIKYFLKKGTYIPGRLIEVFIINSQNINKLGIAVNKKSGNSVQRNQIKRYILANPESAKSQFIGVIVQKTDFDDVIKYLLKVYPLLRKRKLSDEEIEKFYEAKKQEGMSKEEIIDLLYSNMIM